MRILVVGASGMLGSDLVPVLREQGHEVLAPSSKELDITDPASVARIPAGEFGRLDWTVNCAAYTAVDRAEEEVKEATELNALAPGYLARACASEGSRLLHISTDFVFDGTSLDPYDEEANTNPLGVYGRTKRDGEDAVLEAHSNAIVLRTSWLYGPNGNSFPRTMIRAYEAGKQLRVVSDQIGCPTYTFYLAHTIEAALARNLFPGIYHATGPEAMSWHGFAKAAIEVWAGTSAVEVQPIASSEWPTPARRPAYSVLSNAKLSSAGVPKMESVRDALSHFCSRLREKGLT